jgi:hypothetical protein
LLLFFSLIFYFILNDKACYSLTEVGKEKLYPQMINEFPKNTETDTTMANIAAYRVAFVSIPLSAPGMAMDAAVFAMLWGEIILPIAPPVAFPAAIRNGSAPVCNAGLFSQGDEQHSDYGC